MKKIFFTYRTGFCGSDGHEVIEFDDDVIEFDDDVTDEHLDQCAREGALSNAETYGIYPKEDKPENYDEEESYGDEYFCNIEGYWEPYVEEKHGGYV